MTSKRKMTFNEAKAESDSDDKNPRAVDQARALSNHNKTAAEAWAFCPEACRELGPEVVIELLKANKDTVSRVIDAKVAEINRQMAIAAAQPDLQVFSVKEADGEAGSSGTEPPRTPAKTAAVMPTPPSTGNHRDTAHNIVDGEEGCLWTETLRAQPEVKARFAALINEAIGKEVGILFPKTE